ncbi:porin [Massilia sp. CCM 9029]|nr:porin [Massilia sp. CCM 9029]
MKLSISFAAAAVLGSLSGWACAQSSVTMYGVVDAGLVREQGGAGGKLTRVSSGVGSATRIGFRGSEDLGYGWSANFLLEAGARIDTGEQEAAGALFQRQAYVGARHRAYGGLTLGRQYTPYYNALTGVADPFGGGYAGTAKNLFPAGGQNTRTSNAIVYSMPEIMGMTGEVSYALGEQPGSSTAGRQFGVSLGYSQGGLNARLAYNHRNNDVTAAAGAAAVPPLPAADRDIGRNTLLAANYDFGVARAYAAYGVDKGANSALLPNSGNPYGGVRPTASTDSRDMLLGASVPFGMTTLMASYIRKNDRTAYNQDAHQWGVGASHALSRRTSLYTAYARIKNKRGAGYTVGNNTDTGSGDSAFNLGVRHVF